MNEHYIMLTRKCQASCSFCPTRRAENDPRFISAAELTREIDDAVSRRATPLLSGGEPTLHPDFPELMEMMRKRPYREWHILETNGFIFADPKMVAVIEGVRWQEVRLHAPSPNPAVYDKIVGAGQAFKRFRAALRNLKAAGSLPVVLNIPITTANVKLLAHYLAIPEVDSSVGIRVQMVDPARAQSGDMGPNAGKLYEVGPPPIAEVIPAVAAFRKRATDAGHAFHFGPHWYVAPCAQEGLHRGSEAAFTETRSGAHPPFVGDKAEACQGCAIAAQCPGPADYPEAYGTTPEPQPFNEEQGLVAEYFLRRDHELHMEEIRRRDEVQNNLNLLSRDNETHNTRKAIIRVNFLCNMSCPFCFVDLDKTKYSWEQVSKQIDEVAEQRITFLSFSGGEPTLAPFLADAIKRARERGIRSVEIQTNGMRVQSAEDAQRLVDAGLTHVTLSLHGSCAEVADRNTNTPGGFEKTVLALGHLAETGVQIDLNYVINALNVHDAEAFADFVASEIAPRWRNVTPILSIVRPDEYFTAKDRSPFAPYGEIIPAHGRAIARFKELGVRFGGLGGGCSVAPCLYREEPQALTEVLKFGVRQRAEGANRYLERCDSCAAKDRCGGVARNYLLLYGSEEFQPLRRDEVDAALKRGGVVA